MSGSYGGWRRKIIGMGASGSTVKPSAVKQRHDWLRSTDTARGSDELPADQDSVVAAVAPVYTGEEEVQPVSMGNYIGPYWSNGKIQRSVEFGEAEAKSKLDGLARLHDTAYAHYGDSAHREAADLIFAAEAKKLVGKFPRLAATAVQYGNYTGRQGSKLLSYVTQPHPVLSAIGLAKFAYEGMRDSQKRIDGTYLSKEKQDVLALYSRDTRRNVVKGEKPVISADPRIGVRSSGVSKAGKVSPGVRKGSGPTVSDIPVVAKPKVRGTNSLGSCGSCDTSPTPREILVSNQARRMLNYKNKQIAARNSKLKPSAELKFMPGTPEFYMNRFKKAYTFKRKNQVLPEF